jgi:tRNA1(Val) A37 N6-methylase TrmN6
VPKRKLLRNKIQDFYRTQDRCAYELGIDAAILSRIINCTKNPNEEQMGQLCNYLNMTAREVNTKDE